MTWETATNGSGRWVLISGLGLAAVLVLVVILLSRAGDAPPEAGSLSRPTEESDHPGLIGRHASETQRKKDERDDPFGTAEGASKSGGARPVAHAIQILDGRGDMAAGVRVYLERDVYARGEGVDEHRWRTLDEGTTDARGWVRFEEDAAQPRRVQDGLNHRLRFEPPEDRDDLAPTWRLWKPAPEDTVRLGRTHSVAGVVLDTNGVGVAGATVILGKLPSRGTVRKGHAWTRGTTDAEGRFRIRGIPTTSDWKIDVWALRPGEAEPETSRDVREHAVASLDDRALEIRLP